MHVSPAALDAAIQLLEGRGDQEQTEDRRTGNVGEFVEKLAVRQGFEPWIQLLGRITV